MQFRRRSSADVCAKGMPLELCSVRVTFVLLLPVPKIVEYLNSAGVSPFARWREKLDNVTRARITLAIFRLEAGNFSAAKGVGGIHELRLDFGPGYRVYFGKDGEQLVILLGGGTKKRQQSDIEAAQALWREYKRTKATRRSDDADKEV